MKRFLSILLCQISITCIAIENVPVKTDMLNNVPQYIQYEKTPDAFCIVANGETVPICVSPEDWPGVIRAAKDLGDDIRKVSGTASNVIETNSFITKSIIVGTIGKSPLIDKMVSEKKLDVSPWYL